VVILDHSLDSSADRLEILLQLLLSQIVGVEILITIDEVVCILEGGILFISTIVLRCIVEVVAKGWMARLRLID
jgi:hypothetical protein